MRFPLLTLPLLACGGSPYEFSWDAPTKACLGDSITLTVTDSERPEVFSDVFVEEATTGTVFTDDVVGQVIRAPIGTETEGDGTWTFSVTCDKPETMVEIKDQGGTVLDVFTVTCDDCSETEDSGVGDSGTPTTPESESACDPDTALAGRSAVDYWADHLGALPAVPDMDCGPDPFVFNGPCSLGHNFGTVDMCDGTGRTEVLSGPYEAMTAAGGMAAFAIWNWDTDLTEYMRWSGKSFESTPLDARAAALSDDGSAVVSSRDDLSVYLRDGNRGAGFTKVELHPAGTWAYVQVDRPGRWVVALSTEAVAVDDTNGSSDIYAFDTATLAATRISFGEDGSQISLNFSTRITDVTPDGRCLAYYTDYGVSAADTNGETDVYVIDRDSDGNGTFDEPGTVTVGGVSVVDGTGAFAEGGHDDGRLSDDCRFVVWDGIAGATELSATPTQGVKQAYVHDRQANRTAVVSVDGTGVAGNDESFRPQLSPDGSAVMFVSTATNLGGGDGTWTLTVAPNPLW